MKSIALIASQLIAIVDDDTPDEFIAQPWRHRSLERTGLERTGYAFFFIGTRQILMHRLIMNAAKGQLVDHKNRDGLDNRRENLRIATARQNATNSPPQRNNTSGYKGVSRGRNGQWEVRIGDHMKQRYVGARTSAYEAALLYDRAAREVHGEFAYLNFPGLDLHP